MQKYLGTVPVTINVENPWHFGKNRDADPDTDTGGSNRIPHTFTSFFKDINFFKKSQTVEIKVSYYWWKDPKPDANSDPYMWLTIRMRIREAKNIRIQRIRIRNIGTGIYLFFMEQEQPTTIVGEYKDRKLTLVFLRTVSIMSTLWQ